jgi:hypothetical protein
MGEEYKFKLGELVKLKEVPSVPASLQGQFGIVVETHACGTWGKESILTESPYLPAYTLHLAIDAAYYSVVLWNEDEIEKANN